MTVYVPVLSISASTAVTSASTSGTGVEDPGPTAATVTGAPTRTFAVFTAVRCGSRRRTTTTSGRLRLSSTTTDTSCGASSSGSGEPAIEISKWPGRGAGTGHPALAGSGARPSAARAAATA